MNINEKGVHHMVVRTRRSKKGEHRNIFMFFTRYHRAFSLFFMLISFSFFFFSTILPSRHGMGIMGLQMRFFLHVALWQRMHMACASRSWFFFFVMYRRAAEV
ncbi:hypothetical protein M438DRAFT_4396 [Aureobasidium pullulans EXF-150]|uniref:Transmembrane protein n=1 Tax=Aureobasidium pullulans EXF-150 TaxID=1043002 RepID=A0A074Y068_AURPU|nr:uncharacterized protein M438DRAFT_4396 [Aureobasidium pullulans EXF-150]KEQ89324.1 hypothetical protein M438DRAFT_4396 [Aureobasidium pullulans EXF-150]